MIPRTLFRPACRAAASCHHSLPSSIVSSRRNLHLHLTGSRSMKSMISLSQHIRNPSRLCFSTKPSHSAQPANADALIEDINELYATARDEFEIAAEETVKKTVYAADDRAAAQEALKELKDKYGKVLHESGPEIAKEVQGRIGQRIRELENAVKAMEESALED